MKIDQEMLSIIACPKCKGALRLNEEEKGLVCDACALLYEVRNDIPVLLVDEAVPLKEQPGESEGQ